MWPSKIKSKHAVLAQENDFCPTFFHRTLRGVKCTPKLNNKYDAIALECNKCDLTVAPCFLIGQP
jgi:hypothetical protein